MSALPANYLAIPPPPSPLSPVQRQQGGAAAAAGPAGAGFETAGSGLFVSSSSSTGRLQLRRALRSNLFTLANLWTCALVATVLLALIFRAMQPTEAPSISILRHEWELDPANDAQVRLAIVELDGKGVGRYTMQFAPARLVVHKPPPPPAVPPGEEGAGAADPRPLEPAMVYEEADVVASVEVPGWALRLGHSDVLVSVDEPSAFFPYEPDAELLLSAVFDGSVAVFASLPSRIYMTCRVKASVLDNDALECVSRYVAHIRKG